MISTQLSILFVLLAVAASVYPSNVDARFFFQKSDKQKEDEGSSNEDPRQKYLKLVSRSQNGNRDKEQFSDFGTDVSFPIHHPNVSTNYPWLPHNVDPTLPIPPQYKDMVVNPLGDRQSFYDEFVDGCLKAFGPKGGRRCKETEADRLLNSAEQTASMKNYTHIGFKKIRAPPALYSVLHNFWLENKDNGSQEEWGVGNTYTNNWVSNSYMVSIEDAKLRGSGSGLKQKIWDEARDVISEWTGQELVPASLYGIRIYTEGAILAPHVDRLPLVSSAIINVDQDVDEPWLLEVYGRDGKAYNVTMDAGDMVLYESHSLIHGRPYPLKGRYMANIFVHFEPTGRLRDPSKPSTGYDLDQEINAQYRADLEKEYALNEKKEPNKIKIPPYILEGSIYADSYRQENVNGWKSKGIDDFMTGSQPVHQLAREGELDVLKQHVGYQKTLIHLQDENGFTPLYEGVLGGHVDVVRYLIEAGADYNMRTNDGRGGTALWWAKNSHEEDHPVIEFLESIGALNVGPEL